MESINGYKKQYFWNFENQVIPSNIIKIKTDPIDQIKKAIRLFKIKLMWTICDIAYECYELSTKHLYQQGYLNEMNQFLHFIKEKLVMAKGVMQSMFYYTQAITDQYREDKTTPDVISLG